MTVLHWERYPLVEQQPHGRAWITIQSYLGLAENTIKTYGRALQDYFAFCQQRQVDVLAARREHITLYVHDLRQRPTRSATGLANATIQQRLTVLRLFYDYLREEGLRDDHPVGRGSARRHGLVPRQHALPWLPTDEQWLHLLDVVRLEPLRNRVMFALAYDAGLRREEPCATPAPGRASRPVSLAGPAPTPDASRRPAGQRPDGRRKDEPAARRTG